MVEKKYLCNLCEERFGVNDTRIKGLHYLGSNYGWEEKPARDCETHICTVCLNSLKPLVIKGP